MTSAIRSGTVARLLAATALASFAGSARADEPAQPRHSYPTTARVEYVQECVNGQGGEFVSLYKCSCAIDKIADVLGYDDYVQASTFAKYATLGGEGGGIFRDTDDARQTARSYRTLEAKAYSECGLKRR
ncbi:hypothetical protein [Derxia lacustris]|uniref:hypothetical protein n=1 Tax=Derxia lacustris TaxID=764842 RepID=UPI001F36621D|nr:hypothetical protein [Derxia lacustris]